MRDEKSVKEGEGPLRAAWIILLPEKLKITEISSKALPLQKQFSTNKEFSKLWVLEIVHNKLS